MLFYYACIFSLLLQILSPKRGDDMAVAHKGSISMGLVLIRWGYIKRLWIMISILISFARTARSGYSTRNTAGTVIKKWPATILSRAMSTKREICSHEPMRSWRRSRRKRIRPSTSFNLSGCQRSIWSITRKIIMQCRRPERKKHTSFCGRRFCHSGKWP